MKIDNENIYGPAFPFVRCDAPVDYPALPNTTGKFFGLNGKHYSYSHPKHLIKWEWSNTFNRWGAYVVQDDGTTIYTYPELFNPILEKGA